MRDRRRGWLAGRGDRYGGYLAELDEDGQEIGQIESVPETPSLRVALAWSRERAAKVIVRPSWDEDTHYWAGDPPPRGSMPPLPDEPAWPDDLFQERDAPTDLEHMWLLRCSVCGWCADGATQEAAKEALITHHRATHPQPE